MKIDLHAHTRRYSSCSRLSSDELIRNEWKHGIDGILLTEHNQFWPEDELGTLRSKFPEITIFNGAEITVDSLHHVLTILPEFDNKITSIRDPERFIQTVKENDGFMIAKFL